MRKTLSYLTIKWNWKSYPSWECILQIIGPCWDVWSFETSRKSLVTNFIFFKLNNVLKLSNYRGTESRLWRCNSPMHLFPIMQSVTSTCFVDYMIIRGNERRLSLKQRYHLTTWAPPFSEGGGEGSNMFWEGKQIASRVWHSTDLYSCREEKEKQTQDHLASYSGWRDKSV